MTTTTMTALDWADELDPITLDELNASAERLVRVDRKYLLRSEEVGPIIRQLPGVRVLEIDGQRGTDYSSTYLDTAGLEAYHLAGRGRRRRYKVRIRRYAGGDAFLEVKWRDGRGQTHKQRIVHPGTWPLDGEAQDFVVDTLADAGIQAPKIADLAPVLTTRYRRTTLLLPDEDARATIDIGLTCKSGQQKAEFDEFAVVETKAGRRLTSLDLLLHRHGHRTARMSKYGVGLAATTPGLPATKWRRTLRRLQSNRHRSRHTWHPGKHF
ncbi:VTC domain-containing protein [uncultured Tessaracoccus sp.]|uniref:VTC domain-containing protein n=1 Tax=uncultured Tessaracoccus sp. TaxID=905023 RepID=UPI00261D5DA8|nr:VTC domain-containing protein [uncultured Tessaracoccus sp.]